MQENVYFSMIFPVETIPYKNRIWLYTSENLYSLWGIQCGRSGNAFCVTPGSCVYFFYPGVSTWIGCVDILTAGAKYSGLISSGFTSGRPGIGFTEHLYE